MSKFLDDFKEYIKNNEGRVFSVCEIIGNNLPEKLVIAEKYALKNIC